MKKVLLFMLIVGHVNSLMAQGIISVQNIKSVPSLIVEARKQLCQGDIDESIIVYSQLIDIEKTRRNGGRGVNGDYVAEYAYALALSGLYEGALMNIDLARNLKAPTADFFTGQILKVIGYNELAEGFESKSTAPDWMRSTYTGLYDKYNTVAIMDVSDYSASIQRANTLSSSGQEIQALVIFESLGNQYPHYYLPHICESTMWEQFGNLAFAEKSLSKGLSLYPDDGSDKRKDYANHLTGLEKQLYGKGESKCYALLRKFEPKPMLYIGGSAGKKFFSVNTRFGLYTSDRVTVSTNIGYTYSGISSFNLGLSGYKTWGFFLAGLGISEMFSKKNNIFTISPMTGLSFLNKNGNASYDITLSVDFPIGKGTKVGYTVSFGRTFYFDIKGKKQ